MENSQSNTPVGTSGEHPTLFAVLAYIGILVVVSYLMAKDDPFVKFHVKQGLVLLTLEVAIWVIGSTVWHVWMVLNILNLGVLVLAVIGIINAVHHKEQELPLVGTFARHFPI